MLSFEALEDRSLLSMSTASSVSPALANPEPSDVVQSAAESGSKSLVAQAIAPITSVRDGLWSDANTWSSGRVPGASDDVVVTNNVTIDQATVRQLDIKAGTTTLAGNLQAYGSVIVRSSLVGTHGGIFFHVANDRLFTGNTSPGLDPTMPDFHPEDTGLWALAGSHVDLHGADVTSWLNAAGSGTMQDLGHGVSQRVSFGATSAALQSAPVGWQAGDTLLLVNEQGQSVLADLASVSGSSIQYHQHKAQPTDPDLIGHDLITVGSSTVVQSKIANLTRRIQIVSADVREGDTNHRAHTIYMAGATANLVNVEFRDLGARGKLDRYPVNFHQGGAVSDSLVGSSIWQDVTDPGNRFVALDGVQGVTVANNVAFRSRGDGFFMESGSEFNNSIINNLSVAVTGAEELPNVDSTVTDLTHHFWLRSGNTISGNVAAGGDAVGLIVLASTHPASTPVNDMQVLGAGLYGMWTATANVTFNNPIAVYNSRAGFASDPAWDVDSHGATLNNPLLLFNGTSDFAYGAQLYVNDGELTALNGGVLAGSRAFNTHYHASLSAANTKINVDTLLVPTYWEQAVVLDHVQIQAALLFDDPYPSPRYNSPGLVRFISSSVQVGTAPAEVESADYIGKTFQNYPAMQGELIPNAIELSQPVAASGFIRVTMLSDEDRWMSNIATWTVTPIGQTPQAPSFIYQRQTVWSRLSSLGGYPDGFPPGQYAVSLYTENGVFLKSGFAVVRPGQVSDLTDTLAGNSTVVGRDVFYNQSHWDGQTAGASASDDLAIAGDKTAYLPGSGAATFASITSYSQGVNGIMVDLAGSGAHGAITASDFVFKTGNNNSPSLWATAPAPLSVTVRAGAGVGGSDRVEIVWANGAIRNQWLEVQTLVSANTGLAAKDVFYFGNMVGDSGAGDTSTLAATDTSDELAARNNQKLRAPSASPYDFDRDGRVNLNDQLIARNNFGTLLKLNIGSTTAASGATAGIASALASNSPAAPAQTVCESVAPISAPSPLRPEQRAAAAQFFARLAAEQSESAPGLLQAANPSSEAQDWDDELVDSLLAR